MLDWASGYVDHPWLLLVAIPVAIMFLAPWFRWFFGNLRGLGEDVTVASIPDCISVFTKYFWRGEWAEVKLLYFVLLCIGVVAALYHVFVLLFG